MGGSAIDGLAGLPSTWITTESLAAGFNRPTKLGDLSQLVAVLGGASQCDPIYKVNRAGFAQNSLMSQRRIWHPVKYVMAVGLD